MSIKYIITKAVYIVSGRKMNYIINYFRKSGIDIGEGCNIYSDITTSESNLIKIKNNVTISNDVQLITHDNSICKISSSYTDLFGEIEIGNNCFVGAKTIILPGVVLGDNIIVGAGSVVTKSFKEKNIIIAGNPAKKIGSLYELEKKIDGKQFNIQGLSSSEKINLLLENKQKFVSR